MGDWHIGRLQRSHDRTSFSCGKPPLDEFILRLVIQYDKRNLGRAYDATRPGEARIGGYYTLASGAIAFENLPEPAARKLPRHSVPVILLARLAVDRAAQGPGLGVALLLDALERSLGLPNKVGVHAVEVDAIDQQARAFCEKYGFTPLPDSEFQLFLPVATIRDAIKSDMA